MSIRSKTCLVLILFCLSVFLKEASCDSKSISDTLDKAKEVFKSEKTVSTFKKVTTWMTVGGHLAKAVYDLVKLIKTFTGDNESKELKFLKEQFNIVNTKMDALDYEFSDIKEMIDWNVVRINFGEYERSIKATDLKLNEFITAPKEARIVYQQMFVNTYISHYGDAATKLFNGLIVDSQIFGENLFAVARRYYGNDRLKIAEFGAYVCRIVQRGLNQEAAFMELAGYNESIGGFIKSWEKKFDDLKKYASKIDAEIVASWNTQYKTDADKHIVRNPNLEPQALASTLYKLLDGKFPWRSWIVVVMPHKDNDDKVWKVENCGKDQFSKYNVGKKSIFINSGDAGQKPGVSPTSIIGSLPSEFRGKSNSVTVSASFIFGKIRLNNCRGYAMKAVFRDDVNPVIQGPQGRISVKKTKVVQTRYRYPAITKNYWAILGA